MGQLSRLRRRLKLPAFNRRHFLQHSALLLWAAPQVSAASTTAASSPTAVKAAGQPFQHGVASGDPLSNAVILWTRVTPVASENIPVRVEVFRDPALSQFVGAQESIATAARDWTVKIDFTGLEPATTYYFRFQTGCQFSAVGRTRTVPATGGDRARLGVVSCSNLPAGFFNSYRFLAARADLDAVLHLGDYLYEGGGGTGERAHQPAKEITTLADYRQRHGQYRQDPDLQAMTQQHPFIVVWDDHESTNDSWRDGADNHTEGAEGNWAQRKAWAQQAYDEWLPIRLPESNNPARIWRQYRYGNLFDLILLDTRLFDRDIPFAAPPPPDANLADTARKMLGPVQKQFFFDALAATGATWKIVGQQVMFGQLKVVGSPNAVNGGGQYLNGDQWDGYQADRSAVFNHLARGGAGGTAINNVVVLTGDIHTSWAMDLTPDPNNAVEAAGGYNPVTGGGSRAVEFVTTSVTSSGLEELMDAQDAIRGNNPHIKYVDLAQKGYLLVDITPTRVTGEWWYVSTIATRGGTESFATAFPVQAGQNRLGAATTMTAPKANPPPLAPTAASVADCIVLDPPTPEPVPEPVPTPKPIQPAKGRFGGGALDGLGLLVLVVVGWLRR
jgi:alkaline phosphatase D